MSAETLKATDLPDRTEKPKAPVRGWLLDRAPFLVACLMLLIIVAIYGSLQKGVFTLDEINLDTAAAMTLMLAATGQTIVLIRGGIDLSIGGMISLGTVIGAFILTLIGNLVFVLHVSSYWQPVMSGAILLVAVLASSMAEKSARGLEQ